jgi:hypothetical protein
VLGAERDTQKEYMPTWQPDIAVNISLAGYTWKITLLPVIAGAWV